MSLYNSQGELNASSLKDALNTIAKYASIIEENTPSNMNIAGQPGLSEAQRDQLISQAIMTQEGKMALAQAMANPIRRNLDYSGIARRTLVVDPLPQGAFATYERDIDVTACVISSNGTPPESRVFGDRITVPEFTIASNPTVNINEVRRRRFNIIDRAVQKARQELQAQEDANIFAAIDQASSQENAIQDITDTGLTKRDLVEIRAQIDKWDLVTSKFFMNINEFQDVLNWTSGGSTPAEIDPVTQREILQTGLMAHIWGADLMVSKMVPPGTVYGVADPEFLGVMPIRSDVEVFPADEPKRMLLGWVIAETIGIAIVNARAAAKGMKGYVLGS